MKHNNKVRVWFSNITLALFNFYFAYNAYNVLTQEFRISLVLLLIFNTYMTILSIVRRIPIAVTSSALDYIITLCGVLTPMVFIGLVEKNDNVVFLALQITGICFSFVALTTLNRSFGLLPANRGIVTKGLYSFVRHPLYFGYVLLCTGFVLQNFCLRNLVAFMIFAIFESLRLLIEEEFLKKNKEYAAYMRTVRWRVLPGIW